MTRLVKILNAKSEIEVNKTLTICRNNKINDSDIKLSYSNNHIYIEISIDNDDNKIKKLRSELNIISKST